jgi:hypothetical protein
LISKEYLLTALEFYAELCEDGIDIRELKDYFANSKNFETGTGRRYVPTVQKQTTSIFYVQLFPFLMK